MSSKRCLLEVLFLSIVFVTNLPPSMQKSAGIDVSVYQGTIDWQKVALSGITFAVARATIGQSKQDANFMANWQGMRQHIPTPAAYHYFECLDSGSAQRDNIESFLANTDFDRNTDILAIDVESSFNNCSATVIAETLNDLLTNLSDYKNLYIYCSYYFWEDSVAWNLFDFSQYNLWIAHYTSKLIPYIPTTWKAKGYTWWQYSNTGRVDGIEVNVDLNRKNFDC